ncbi:MAG: hypothetical protein IT204_08745 [Fimbriimonadaceae bacterium]|nr:hypothetical protein [Fimbriimonadaceae bacterium]
MSQPFVWTAATPIYLPLVYPPSLLAAAYRLSRDVALALGAPAPLYPQPAPLGQPAILIGPDPAYTAVVAPAAPETFAVQTSGDELTLSGADPRGTVLGLAWLAATCLGRDPWTARAPAAAAWTGHLHHVQPPWPTRHRAWAFAAAELATLAEDSLWDLGETLLRAGGNHLSWVGEPPPLVAAVATQLGLQSGPATRVTATLAHYRSGTAEIWW